MTIQEILDLRYPFLKDKKVKLIRHADPRNIYDFKTIKKDKEKLLEYQSQQNAPVFSECDYIVSFLGKESKSSLLIGVFKVKGYKEVNGIDHKYLYDLEDISDESTQEELYDRVMIDWGKATTSWHQWYDKEKEVTQILPLGYVGEFPGYDKLIMDSFDLKRLAKFESANGEWVHKLSAVSGVYLILDQSTGRQYIGSAYGLNGIWGRWKQYAYDGHGENTRLKELMMSDPEYNQNFQYSILQTLPRNLSEKEVIAVEGVFKEKLGSRAFGLNKN